METVNRIELTDESTYPDEVVLRAVLEESYDSYCALLDLCARNGLRPEWRYYHDGKAWLCKVQHKSRTIVWMSAWRGYMQATIYVPERQIDQVYELPLAPDTKNRIKATRNVGTSKPCIFEIRDAGILEDLDMLVKFKIRAR